MSRRHGSSAQTFSHLACWLAIESMMRTNGLVTVEQPVATGQQVSLQPALTLMLAEHRVENLSGRREELVVLSHGEVHWRSVTSKTACRRFDTVSSGPKRRKLRWS